MLIDKFLMLSDDQAITATADCANPLPLDALATMAREANGEPMEICLQVTETFTAVGAATLTVSLSTGNSAALGSPQVQFTYAVIPKATLVKGKTYKFPFQMPVADADASHYGLNYAVATGPFTAGKVSAWVQPTNTNQNGLV